MLGVWRRREGGACGAPGEQGYVERFRQQTHAPSTWLEAVYYSAEAIRWPTARTGPIAP